MYATFKVGSKNHIITSIYSLTITSDLILSVFKKAFGT